jgi:hypothetical protein
MNKKKASYDLPEIRDKLSEGGEQNEANDKMNERINMNRKKSPPPGRFTCPPQAGRGFWDDL